MNFNNLNKKNISDMILQLYAMGFLQTDILEILHNNQYTVSVMKATISVVKKKYPNPPRGAWAFQSQIEHLASLQSLSIQSSADSLLSAFLWNHLELRDLREYVNGLMAGCFHLLYADVSEEDMPYGNLLETIFEASFIQSDANWNKFSDVGRCIKNYLTYMHRQSKDDSVGRRYEFPRSMVELKFQLALCFAKTQGPLHIGTGLAWDKEYTIVGIHKVLDDLTHQEKQVLSLRFGLDNRVVNTYDQVAEEMKIDIDHVSQVERKAIEKLRHPEQYRRLMYALTPHCTMCCDDNA
jgi:hypothetical protein